MVWVALLAEGVDRNDFFLGCIRVEVVALLAEGVDRNFLLPLFHYLLKSRPPRGGRG